MPLQFKDRAGHSIYMEDKKKERWEELAEQVSREQDSARLLELTRELDKALAETDAKKKEGNQSPAA
jgi:hypothetical protein